MASKVVWLLWAWAFFAFGCADDFGMERAKLGQKGGASDDDGDDEDEDQDDADSATVKKREDDSGGTVINEGEDQIGGDDSQTPTEFGFDYPKFSYKGTWTHQTQNGTETYNSNVAIKVTDDTLVYDVKGTRLIPGVSDVHKTEGTLTYQRATKDDLQNAPYSHGLIFAKGVHVIDVANTQPGQPLSEFTYTVSAPYPVAVFPGGEFRYEDLLAEPYPKWKSRVSRTYESVDSNGAKHTATVYMDLEVTVSATKPKAGEVVVTLQVDAAKNETSSPTSNDWKRINLAKTQRFTIDTEKKVVTKIEYERFSNIGDEVHHLCSREQGGNTEPFACGL